MGGGSEIVGPVVGITLRLPSGWFSALGYLVPGGTDISPPFMIVKVTLVVGKGKEGCVIALTLGAKRVLRAVGRAALPEEEVLRLVLDGRNKVDGGIGVSINVGRPEDTDRAVIHEGESVAWVSAEVAEAHDGWVLDLESSGPGRVGLRGGWASPVEHPMGHELEKLEETA
jgi:hypothetical protein